MLTYKVSGKHSHMPWDTFRVENADKTPSSTEIHFKLQLIDMISYPPYPPSVSSE